MRAARRYTAILATGAILALSSCINDGTGEEKPPKPSSKAVTFVVSAPATDAGVTRRNTRAAGAEDLKGGNGHFPDGVPDSYRNYNADADTEKYGTLFGGYPDAEAEAAAFAKAVSAMTENYGSSPAVRSEGAGGVELSTKGQDSNVATRAIPEGSIHDNRIDEISVLFFDSDQIWVDVKYVGGTDEPQLSRVDGDLTRWKFTLPDMKDGNYTAVFVANSRDAVQALVPGFMGQSVYGTLAVHLKSLHTMSDANPWNIDTSDPNFKAFPMTSKEVQFSIPLNRDFSEQPVEMFRALAKINLRIDDDLAANQNVRIEQIAVRNYNGYGRLIPSSHLGGVNSGGEIDMFHSSNVNEDADERPSSPMTYSYPAPSYTTQSVDEIFVWEQLASESRFGGTQLSWDLCLLVKLAPGYTVPSQSGGSETLDEGRWYRVDLLKKENPTDANPRHVNIYRNFVYDITITGLNTRGYGGSDGADEAYHNLPAGLTYDVNARDAHDGDTWMVENTWNGEYQITTDRSVVVIGPKANDSATVNIYTDYSGGYTSSMPAFATGGNAFSVTGGSYLFATPHAMPLTIKAASDWNGNYVRKTRFSIFAGELHKSITVVQLPKPENVAGLETTNDLTDYTGAFWRADQRGERLIGLKEGKDWSAFVLGGADWVVMDAKSSTDPNVGTSNAAVHSGNDVNFETEHSVNSTVGWASGKAGEGKKYFRLGLRNSHAATPETPARYALVYLIEGYVGNMSQLPPDRARLIYLRQGHDADYLFSKSERANDANMRFSPYNLTVPESKPFGANGSVQLDPKGGVWTGYPTQAGALFQFSSATAPRVAWHPTTPATPTTGWNATDENLAFDPNTMETCPPGYRRPVGGQANETNPPSPGHEIVHSLWKNRSFDDNATNGDNAFYGFYADGFFDRREVTGTVSNHSEPAANVSSGAGIAYEGMLMYNNNPGSSRFGASIFFPFSGVRYNTDGHIVNSGGGNYWSSTRVGGSNNSYDAYYMSLGNGSPYYPIFAQPGISQVESHAFSVRCVKIPDYESIPELVPAPPGVIGIKHTDLMALRNGTKFIEENPGHGVTTIEFPQAVSPTIKGSSVYKGTWVERIATGDPNIGALEDEPVYTLYFKWGSVVGLLGRDGRLLNNQIEVAWWIPSDSGDGMAWMDSRILNFSNQTVNYDYQSVNAYDPAGTGGYEMPIWVSHHTPSPGYINALNYNGDPCEFVNGATPDNRSGWKTPSGNPWTYVDPASNTGSTPFGTAIQPVTGPNTRWMEASGSVPAGLATNDGSIFLPAAGGYNDTGVFASDYGSYWTATAEERVDADPNNVSWTIYAILFDSSQLMPAGNGRQNDAMPIRCVNCKPVEDVTITGDVDGVPITADPDLTIGNTAQTITLTAGATVPSDATYPVSWHWEYSIGDDTSWIDIPNSKNKTTIVTSTHDDVSGIDFALVGGKNRFRVVASNLCTNSVNSNAITISLRLPALTYAIIGTDIYSWTSNRKTALTNAIDHQRGVLNKDNPNAIIKTAGLTELWHLGNDPTRAANLLKYGKVGGSNTVPTAGTENNKGAFPDILLYFSFAAYPNANLVDALVDYTGKGGTVMYAPACDNTTYIPHIGQLLNGIFPGENLIAELKSPNDDDTAYKIWDLINDRDLQDDPVVNGPFGNLSGGNCFLGDENFYTTCVRSLPAGSVQIAALRNDATPAGKLYPAEWSFCWYNKAKNFFYIGDCTAATGSDTSSRAFAAIYNYSTSATNPAVGMPGSKMYGFYDNRTTAGTRRVYNAVLEMNALSWCMTRAARNGINPH